MPKEELLLKLDKAFRRVAFYSEDDPEWYNLEIRKLSVVAYNTFKRNKWLKIENR